MNAQIEAAKEKFGKLLEAQLERVEIMNQNKEFIDYNKLDEIVIGVVGGDGIGPSQLRLKKYLNLCWKAKRLFSTTLKAVQSKTEQLAARHCLTMFWQSLKSATLY